MKRKTSSRSKMHSRDDFSVSTGAKVFVSPRSPLGRTYNHDHYIRPVPPIYVTEYESAYQWPPDYAYISPREHSYSPRNSFSPAWNRRIVQTLAPQVQKLALPAETKKPADIDSKSNWHQLHEAAAQLVERGYEVRLLTPLLRIIESRKLDTCIEYAYEQLNTHQQQHGGSGQGEGPGQEQGERSAHRDFESEMRLKFINAVKGIKTA